MESAAARICGEGGARVAVMLVMDMDLPVPNARGLPLFGVQLAVPLHCNGSLHRGAANIDRAVLSVAQHKKATCPELIGLNARCPRSFGGLTCLIFLHLSSEKKNVWGVCLEDTQRWKKKANFVAGEEKKERNFGRSRGRAVRGRASGKDGPGKDGPNQTLITQHNTPQTKKSNSICPKSVWPKSVCLKSVLAKVGFVKVGFGQTRSKVGLTHLRLQLLQPLHKFFHQIPAMYHSEHGDSLVPQS